MFSRAAERLWRAGALPPGSDHSGLLHPLHGRDGVCRPPPRHGTVPRHHHGHLRQRPGDRPGPLVRGVLDYLVKPFAFARFRQAMDKFLQTQNLLSCPQESSLLDQQAIDRLIRRQEHPEPGGNQMSKGLNAATLERVRSFLSASRGQALTSEEIAEQVHLSRITIRRYVNYMVETGSWPAPSTTRLAAGPPSVTATPGRPLSRNFLYSKPTKVSCKFCANLSVPVTTLPLTVQMCRSGGDFFLFFGCIIQSHSGYFTYKSHSIGTKIDFASGDGYTFS